MNIGFIGAGNMAYALAKAMDEKVVCYDILQERLELFKKEFNADVKTSNKDVVESSDVTFIAVKPQHISVLEEIKDTDALLVSIAAGVTLKTLEKALPNARIVRVMPNTPCMIQEMAAGYALGITVSAEDATLVKELLSRAGVAIEVKEELLDAVTGLSGSGPAFVARILQAMIDAGVSEGLSEDVAKRLTLQTAIGTAKLLETISAEELVNMVSSPGGTTVAGREVLEKSDYKEIIGKTISAATKKSKELR